VPQDLIRRYHDLADPRTSIHTMSHRFREGTCFFSYVAGGST
jgi:hypothetical protein